MHIVGVLGALGEPSSLLGPCVGKRGLCALSAGIAGLHLMDIREYVFIVNTNLNALLFMSRGRMRMMDGNWKEHVYIMYDTLRAEYTIVEIIMNKLKEYLQIEDSLSAVRSYEEDLEIEMKNLHLKGDYIQQQSSKKALFPYH